MHGEMNVGTRRDIVDRPIPASFPLGQAWFVLFVSPHRMHWDDDKETQCFSVEVDIRDLGFETYVPAERKWVIRRQRKIEAVTPAFGPYVFVKFDREADDWGQLLPKRDDPAAGIRGVYDLLRNMDVPLRVPDIVIERMKRAEEAGLFGLSTLNTGIPVEIMEGPFSGLIGKVLSAKAHKRAKILLNALCTVDIDPCFLRKI